MPPVFVIIQALPQHRHDLVACHHVVGQVWDTSHLWAGRPPGVIRGRLSHLGNTREVLSLRRVRNITRWLEHLPTLLNEWMRHTQGRAYNEAGTFRGFTDYMTFAGANTVTLKVSLHLPSLQPRRNSERDSSVSCVSSTGSWCLVCVTYSARKENGIKVAQFKSSYRSSFPPALHKRVKDILFEEFLLDFRRLSAITFRLKWKNLSVWLGSPPPPQCMGGRAQCGFHRCRLDIRSYNKNWKSLSYYTFSMTNTDNGGIKK